ncbi:ion channel [Halobacteriovorax sp. ZH4_bin.1]|uniref:ion channel n=1 Tax=unclassified Halobacteriovorax TaxID=2639665 RepID=UPI00371629CC
MVGKTEKERVRGYLKSTRKKIKYVYHDKEKYFGIERYFTIILLITRFFSVISLLRCSVINKYLTLKICIEVWVVLKPLILFILLCINIEENIRFYIASYFLFDLFSVLFNLVYLRDLNSEAISYNRNLILLNFNFAELVLGFSNIYYSNNSLIANCEKVHSWVDYVYFSLATSTSVGYGDMTTTDKPTAIIQMFLSFIFIAIVFSTYISRREEKSIELRKDT